MSPPEIPNTNTRLPYRLDGKVALVTGSGRGIGSAIAVELGRCGAKVVVNYAKSSGPAEKIVDEIKSFGRSADAVAIQGDVGDVRQTVALFEKAVKHFGQLNIVCSNSGVVSFGHLEDVTEEEFDRVFRVNTRGQYFVAREAYKHLQHGGRIIMMSSNTTRDKIVPNHSIYAGSKGAIESFVRCFALDCGRKNITVNAIAPGATVTDMFHEVQRSYLPNGENLTEEELNKFASAVDTPLSRPGTPKDIARVACFLASEEGEWINGKTIAVDGAA